MARKQTFNSKSQLNKILQDVDTIQGEAIIDEKNKTISAKFSGTIKGGYMANDGFTPKQLEQLGLLIKPINDRLDVIEKDIKAIKECPTIKKELEENK